MFQSLSSNLTKVLDGLKGKGRLTDKNIQDTVKQIRKSLLNADVALPVVKGLIEDIRKQAVGQQITSSINPGQMFTKLVYDELVSVLGEASAELSLNHQPPVCILMAGLQGSGKTTTTIKLARWIKNTNKKVMVVSTDIYRPAAMAQLAQLAEADEIPVFQDEQLKTVPKIAAAAIAAAKQQFCDVLIVDTAGRLTIDDEMMDEIQQLHQQTDPQETLFICDAMTGQDAAHTARAFHDKLQLTGVVLTKIDGDARGGAALSIRKITDAPIKFMGTGEKSQELEVFHPERIASRILGMGDMASLAETIEKEMDVEKSKKLAKKLKKGKGFNLTDFQEQLKQMSNMGGVGKLMSQLPGMGGQLTDAHQHAAEASLKKTDAIINSMTLMERQDPKVINASRKKRIASGSGTRIQDVNQLLKQFTQMQKMMKKFSSPSKLMGLFKNNPGLM